MNQCVCLPIPLAISNLLLSQRKCLSSRDKIDPPWFGLLLIGLKQSLGYFIDKIDSAFLGNLQLIFGLEYLIRRNLASSFFMHEEKKSIFSRCKFSRISRDCSNLKETEFLNVTAKMIIKPKFLASKFVLFLCFQRVKKMRYFLDFPHRVVHKNNGQVTSLTIIILPESRNVKMSLKNDQKINELQKWAPKKKLQVALLNADWLCHCNLEEELTDDKATKKLWLDHCLWVFLCFRGNYKIKNSGNITKTRKRVKKANKTESISQNESSKHTLQFY